MFFLALCKLTFNKIYKGAQMTGVKKAKVPKPQGQPISTSISCEAYDPANAEIMYGEDVNA